MATTLVLPDGYRNVVFISAGIIPLFAFLHGFLVTGTRVKAGIKYPNHYATPQEAKESQIAYRFNCMQRAHGQLLENMPQTMVTMLIAGLEFPRATAALGLGWVALRTVYFAGYAYSGKPGGAGRLYGVPFWFMQGGIWGLSLLTAMRRM